MITQFQLNFNSTSTQFQFNQLKWVNLHHHPFQLTNQVSTGSQPTFMKPLSCFVTKSSFCWLRDNTPSVMKWTRLEPYLTGLVPNLSKCMRTWRWNKVRTRGSVRLFSRHSNVTSNQPNLYSKTGTSWVDSILGCASPKVTS